MATTPADEKEEIEKGVTEFENAIHETGFGIFNIKLIILCGLSMLTTFVEVLSMSYVLPAAQYDLRLTLFDKSVISSIGFLGVAVSCLFWGFLADIIGRKHILVVTTFLSFLFGIASSLVYIKWLFIVLRFLNGFFIACPTAIIFTYTSECHSKKYRYKAISWMGSFIAVSYIYLPCISWFILSSKFETINTYIQPWRLLTMIFSFPSIIFCACFYHYPESPKFLWSIGKFGECLEILRDIYKSNTKKDASTFPITEFEFRKKSEVLLELLYAPKSFLEIIAIFFKSMRDRMVPLFTMPLLPKTVITSLMQFGIHGSALGFIVWFPDIVNKVILYEKYHTSGTICEAIESCNKKESKYLEEDEMACSDGKINEHMFVITIIYGIAATVFFTIIGFVIDIVGRKMVLVIILFVTGMSGIIANFMKDYYSIMTFLIAFLLCGMGSNTSYAIQVDLFPTEHRAKALAFAQMMGRCGGMTGSFLIGNLFKVCCPVILYLFPTILLGLILLSFLLPVPFIICGKGEK